MIKSIIIDFVVLKKLDLSVKDFLFLVHLNNKDPLLSLDGELSKYNPSRLIEKAYIKLDKEEVPHLRQEGIDLLSYLSIDSFKEFKQPKIIKKSSKKIKAEVLERVGEYRGKWHGLKAGSMGDRQSCITKLSRWMETNPEYSFEQILDAAQLYLDTEGTNLTYLQRADYFIYKQESNKEETSRLAAFIDEVGTTINRDWTSTLN